MFMSATTICTGRRESLIAADSKIIPFSLQGNYWGASGDDLHRVLACGTAIDLVHKSRY